MFYERRHNDIQYFHHTCSRIAYYGHIGLEISIEVSSRGPVSPLPSPISFSSQTSTHSYPSLASSAGHSSGEEGAYLRNTTCRWFVLYKFIQIL